MQYKITFASDIAADDAFQALVSEQGFEHVVDDGWFTDANGKEMIKNIGGKLFVKGDDFGSLKDLIQLIVISYKDYHPQIKELKESYKPTKNYAAAFRAMRDGNLKKYEINEAVTALKSVGAQISEGK